MFAGNQCSHKGGAKPSFPTNIFLAKGGPWPIWPRGKYATACQKLYDIQQGNLVDELERRGMRMVRCICGTLTHKDSYIIPEYEV